MVFRIQQNVSAFFCEDALNITRLGLLVLILLMLVAQTIMDIHGDSMKNVYVSNFPRQFPTSKIQK